MGRLLKMQLTVVMAVLVMVAATSVVNVNARLDLSQILDSIGIQTDSNYESGGGSSACCDACFCTKSIPPQCQCADIKTSCYKGCQSCGCTKSIPPQCRCFDVKDFCYPQCSTTTEY